MAVLHRFYTNEIHTFFMYYIIELKIYINHRISLIDNNDNKCNGKVERHVPENIYI